MRETYKLPGVLSSIKSAKLTSELNHHHLYNRLSDHQYDFRKGRSPGDLLAFLTESWSSSLTDFGETLAAVVEAAARGGVLLWPIT